MEHMYHHYRDKQWCCNEVVILWRQWVADITRFVLDLHVSETGGQP